MSNNISYTIPIAYYIPKVSIYKHNNVVGKLLGNSSNDSLLISKYLR